MNPRIIHLEAIIKTLCDVVDPALASLRASIDQADNATLPDYSTRMARRTTMESAYKAIVAARLEVK